MPTSCPASTLNHKITLKEIRRFSVIEFDSRRAAMAMSVPLRVAGKALPPEVDRSGRGSLVDAARHSVRPERPHAADQQ